MPPGPSPRCKAGTCPTTTDMAKYPRRPDETSEKMHYRQGVSDRIFFWQQRGAEFAELSLSLKTWRPKFNCDDSSQMFSQFWEPHLSEMSSQIFQHVRSRRCYIIFQLMTIHPNPGPRRRNKMEEGKKERRERRYEKRKTKRKEKD